MSDRTRLVVALLALTFSPVLALAQPFPVTIGQNFPGSTAALLNPPPDTMGAVGIDHFVELNNHLFKVYNKNDGSLAQSISDSTFWTNSGITPTGNSFDPRIVYDPHAGRWYAVGVDNGQNPNNFLFAVSNSSDPTQMWTGFQIDNDSSDTHWGDFPMLGYNGEGVYISVNMVSLTTPNPQTTFLVLPKFDLLQPVPNISNMTLIEHVPRATTGFSPHPAVDASNEFGIGMPFLSMENVVTGTLMQTYVSTPGAPAIGGVMTNSITGAADPPTVDQPGPSQNILANDARFSSNSVRKGNELYAVHSVDHLGLAAVRFLRTDFNTGTVLEEQIIVDPASRALTFPSIAVNDFGDVVIGVSGTSTTEYASSYAMVGKTVGGITSFDPPILLKAGVAEYVRLDSLGRNRWGDYSATTIDPTDPSIFWTVQEFVLGTNNWSTQVTELIVPQPQDARWTIPVGTGNFDDPTMWLTSHGGIPLPTDVAIFSRAIDPSGLTSTVLFPTQPSGFYSNAVASIRQGNMMFDLNGNQWDLALQLEVGPYFGNPIATIVNGAVNSIGGYIAYQPTSEGHLTLNNASWNLAAELHIGSDAAPGSAGLLPGASGGTGSLTMVNNSQLTVGVMLKLWKQGTLHLLDGELTAATIDSSHPLAFNFAGGTLHVDTFAGELHNVGGTLAPGNSFGTTNVLLAYNQGSGASLEIEIGGTSPGMFDQLVVGGPANFGGVLDVVVTAGYMPQLSDRFEIVQAGSIPLTGYVTLLANSTLPGLNQLLDFHLFYEPTALTLAVVPSLTGDYNADGVVNAGDFGVWRDMFGATGAGLAADGNFDQVVDNIDRLLWMGNFGAVAPGAGSGERVPEPSHYMLLLTAFAVGLYWRRLS